MNIFDSNSISSEFLKNGLVEVQGEDGAFYYAYIHDVDSAPSSSQQNPTVSGDSGTNSEKQNAANGQTSGESLITVTFQNNSFPKSTVPISRIRLPPASTTTASGSKNGVQNVNQEEALKNLQTGVAGVQIANNIPVQNSSSQSNMTANNGGGIDESIFSPGMEVEVLSSCTIKDQPRGWWRAIIKMMKGDLLKYYLYLVC